MSYNFAFSNLLSKFIEIMVIKSIPSLSNCSFEIYVIMSDFNLDN